MAALLRPRVLLPLSTGALLTAHASSQLRRPILLDAAPRATLEQRARSHPVISARTARQISAGSIAGVLTGVAISTFSKSLAVLIGVIIVTIQALESRGIHLVPYQWLGRKMTSIDWDWLKRNRPFKLAFGATIGLASMGSF